MRAFERLCRLHHRVRRVPRSKIFGGFSVRSDREFRIGAAALDIRREKRKPCFEPIHPRQRELRFAHRERNARARVAHLGLVSFRIREGIDL